ncbi:MAG: PQQ-binding-like beta-propeller repeat protein [Planctomycetota bacterium]
MRRQLALAASLFALVATAEPKVKWEAGTGCDQLATPVVSEKSVFVLASRTPPPDGVADGVLKAFDLETGKERWSVATQGGTQGPATDGDVVAFVEGWTTLEGNTSSLTAVVAKTGERLWSTAVGGGQGDFRSTRAPATGGGRVFCAVHGGLAAFDARTGKEAWRVKEAEAVYPSPAAGGAVVIYGRKNALTAVDASTGKAKWTYRTEGETYGLSLLGSLAIATGEKGTIVALDAATGDLRWALGGESGATARAWGMSVAWINKGMTHVVDSASGKETAAFHSVLHEAGGFGLRLDHEGPLVGCDMSTGDEVWRATLPSRPSLPAVAARDVLILACQDGQVRAVTLPSRAK